MGKENASRRTSVADNKSTLKKRHAGIMTQQPQAMEGVTELGRDGKYLVFVVIFIFFVYTRFRYCCTHIETCSIKRSDH